MISFTGFSFNAFPKAHAVVIQPSVHILHPFTIKNDLFHKGIVNYFSVMAGNLVLCGIEEVEDLYKTKFVPKLFSGHAVTSD